MNGNTTSVNSNPIDNNIFYILIPNLVASVLTFLLQLWSGIKSNHFRMQCSGCCSTTLETIHKTFSGELDKKELPQKSESEL